MTRNRLPPGAERKVRPGSPARPPGSPPEPTATPTPPPRAALLGALFFLGVGAVLFHLSGGPDPADYLLAVGLVALFTPLKALMIRWLGGRRPHASAFAASLFSMVVGLALHELFDIGLLIVRSTIGLLIVRSTVITAALEFPVLYAMRTDDSPRRLLALSAYLSVVVHLLSGGFVLLSRYPAVGALLMGLGVVTLWAPLFLRRGGRRPS